MKQVYISEGTHKKLKELAAKADRKICDITEEVLIKFLAKNKSN
jgi:hypothetical protein